jgi:hypothetical protein
MSAIYINIDELNKIFILRLAKNENLNNKTFFYLRRIL